jgi:hypothetical protein
MLYYVIAADGSRYGPADIDTLNGWIQEGRISPSMLLEEEASGARIAASAVPGLVFQQAPQAAAAAAPSNAPSAPSGGQPKPGPTGNPYSQSNQRPAAPYASADMGTTETVASWILFGIGLIACCCYGFVPSGIGIALAAVAKKKGSASASASLVCNIIACVLSLSLFIFGLIAGPKLQDWAKGVMQQQQQQQMQQLQRMQRQQGQMPPSAKP